MFKVLLGIQSLHKNVLFKRRLLNMPFEDNFGDKKFIDNPIIKVQ